MPTLLSANNYYYRRGGAETVFLEHNALFAAGGWSVVPFAMQHPRNLPSEWSRYFVDELEFGGDYSLLDKLVRVPKVIYSLEARRKLAALLDAARPDLCHAHNLYHHISPSILGVLKSRGIPTVMTLHDLKLACPAYNMLASDGICERCKGGRIHNVIRHRCIKGSTVLSTVIFAEALTHRLLGTYLRHVARFIVPSRFYQQKLRDWGLPGERLVHIPNFIEPGLYSPDPRPGRHFVYVGRLSREKGLATLVRAAARASCRLTLVGTGPQLDELRGLVTEVGADVEFAGFRSGEALHAAIRSARALVLPSECYENAPMSILEAYALGKPVIGARVGGIPELIEERTTGVSFESGNVESLTAALAELASLADEHLAGMGQAAREHVEHGFSATTYRERMLALYREVGVPCG